VRKMNRMPLSTSRRSRQGRPRPSLRLLGLGISGSSTAHWTSVRSRWWDMLQWITANVPPLQLLSETRATPPLLFGTMKESLPSSASLSKPQIEKQNNGTS
jgi:hypothetical protein